MLPAWVWFIGGLGLGLWLGVGITAYGYRRQRSVVCALCRAELPHRDNVTGRKKD